MTRIGTSLTAIVFALLVTAAPVQAASCRGAAHQPTLANGTASPASGTTTTQVTFSVTYADTGDCAPSSVTVTIAGAGTFAMGGSGTTYVSGVTYAVSMTLAPGTHTYSFAATSGENNGAMTVTLTAVSPGSVTIAAPPPPPTAAPTTPKPRPATPKPAPLPPPPTATPSPTPGETPTPGLSSSPIGTATPAATALHVHDSWSPAPPAASMLRPDPADGGSDASSTAPASAFPGILAAYLGMTAAGLVFFAFLMRSPIGPGSGPARLARIPATAVGAPPGTLTPAAEAAAAVGRVTPLPPMRELVPPVDPDLLRDPDDGGPSPEEAAVPRWLRPSVRAARGGPTELRHRDWRA